MRASRHPRRFPAHMNPRTMILAGGLSALALLFAACGGDEPSARNGTDGASDPAGVEVVREPADEVGEDPFTTEMGDGDLTEAVARLSASDRGAVGDGTVVAGTSPGLYGGTGDISRCDADALVGFLDENPDKAEAWAGAVDIDAGEIADYVGTLEPLVLLHDTRVTNHGFSGGRATPHQSVLQAGTAVLADSTGVPRTRCACGNPLAPPEVTDSEETAGPSWPSAEEPVVAVPGPVVPVPAVPIDSDDEADPEDHASDDFCTVWEDVEDQISGGPTGSDDLDAYIEGSLEGFTRLVDAAEHTAGFPADALADLIGYRDDLAAWTGSSSPGSEEVRDRLEEFIPAWCAEHPTGDDGGAPTLPDAAPGEAVVPGANCGSMQFFLLVYTAEGLGVDHTAVSAPYTEALEEVLDGIDPGPTFEVGDLPPVVAYEEVGCEGAQEMYALLVDAGFGDLIAGTDLEP